MPSVEIGAREARPGQVRSIHTSLEALRPSGRYLFEESVQTSEDVPAPQAEHGSDSVDYGQFKRPFSLALPELVSERNRLLFEGDVVTLPSRMCDAASGNFGLHTKRQ